MVSDTSTTPRLGAFVDALQARGRYSFTRAEAAQLERRSPAALEAALRRLRSRGRIASPRRGFLVVVPTEYRSAGSPPASWFIHDLMRFLRTPYYVGLLSAATLHGAAHQQPMVFQVVTDRPTRPARCGRVRIEFHMSRILAATPVEDVQTETGTMRVSTVEATAFDLVRFAREAGGIGAVAAVLSELATEIEAQELLRVARAYAPPDVQRLGFLLERLGQAALAEPLAAHLARRRHRPVRLSLDRGTRARPDQRWRVIPNVPVESEA